MPRRPRSFSYTSASERRRDASRAPDEQDIEKQQLTEQKRTVDVLREIRQTPQRLEVASL